MAAAAIMNVIGVVSGIAGIIQFGMDNLPKQDTKASTLNIAVGLDYDGGLTNAGGHVPKVMLWNEAGEYLGSGGRGKVSDGSTATVTVDQGSNGQQAPYALLVAGNDAICIAYVSITWPDNNQYAFMGDWGEACGGAWYYSNIFVSSSNYKPKCMWIDANGDQPQTGFQVHFPEFKTDDAKMPSGKDTNYFCNSKAPFSLLTTANPNTISYFKPGTTEVATSSPVSKRDTIKARKTRLGRRATADTRLVVTSSTDHSASDLCKSSTSAGPDLANTAEKIFCRMSDKTTFPICDTTTTDNCFNIDSKQLVIGGKAARASYDLFIDWTTEGKTTTTTGNAARDLSSAVVASSASD